MSDHELQAGEQVLVIDRKQRRHLIRLEAGGEFHSHSGVLAHDQLIGQEEGHIERSTKGAEYRVWRPTLSDLIFKMPRGAQVIYPKDLGPILMLADIKPGLHVFESGVGSGALSATMLRMGVRITGYELREDFAERAKANVEMHCGSDALERYDVQLRDCYEGIEVPEGEFFDRVVLDLPEPWLVVPHASKTLVPGGVFFAYTPSITQAVKVREALEEGPWAMLETMEVMNRGWHIDGQAVRPDHRMVAHTAFLTTARRSGW